MDTAESRIKKLQNVARGKVVNKTEKKSDSLSGGNIRFFLAVLFFIRFLGRFVCFIFFLSCLCCKKLHPMQFPQISALRFPFYVNTIKNSEKTHFYH